MLEKARLRKAPGGTWCTTPAPTATALARSAAPRSMSSDTFPNPTGVRSRTIPDSSVSTGGTFCGESHKVISHSPQRRRDAEISAEKGKNKLGGTSRIRGFRGGGGEGAEIAEEEESELGWDWQAEACRSKRKI